SVSETSPENASARRRHPVAHDPTQLSEPDVLWKLRSGDRTPLMSIDVSPFTVSIADLPVAWRTVTSPLTACTLTFAAESTPMSPDTDSICTSPNCPVNVMSPCVLSSDTLLPLGSCTFTGPWQLPSSENSTL